MRKMFFLALVLFVVSVQSFGISGEMTILNKIKNNILLVPFGDYTGTFNGQVGNITPSSGVFTTLTISRGGVSNVYIGNGSGSTDAGSSLNVGIGVESLESIDGDGSYQGRSNVAIGATSMIYSTTGSYNVAIGFGALAGEDTWSGSNNIGIGYFSGAYVDSDSEGLLFVDGYGDSRTSLSDSQAKSLLYGVMTASGSGQSLAINGALSTASVLVPTTTGKYSFGDGDTYFIEDNANQILVKLNGGSYYRFATTAFRVASNGTWGLPNETPSATNPNICPLNTDYTTGIGGASNTVALIVGSTSRITATSSGVVLSGISEYSDNAAAISGGLTTGQLYRTGDILKIVH